MSTAATDGKRTTKSCFEYHPIWQRTSCYNKQSQHQKCTSNETHLYPLNEEHFKQSSLTIKVHGMFSFIPMPPTNFCIIWWLSTLVTPVRTDIRKSGHTCFFKQKEAVYAVCNTDKFNQSYNQILSHNSLSLSADQKMCFSCFYNTLAMLFCTPQNLLEAGIQNTNLKFCYWYF